MNKYQKIVIHLEAIKVMILLVIYLILSLIFMYFIILAPLPSLYHVILYTLAGGIVGYRGIKEIMGLDRWVKKQCR